MPPSGVFGAGVMMESFYNPFQAMDVIVPKDQHADVSRYSQRAGGQPDDSPFPRMIDFWFMALCLAAREGLDPRDLGGVPTTKVIEGTIFTGDPWRVQLLVLLGISRFGDVGVVSEPRKIFTLANGLAAAGIPRLVGMLEDGGAEPIWNISESLRTILAPD